MYFDCCRPIVRSVQERHLRSIIIILLLLPTPIFAQVLGYGKSSAPVYGGTGRTAQPDPAPPTLGIFQERHKTADGKPCISVAPTSRSQIVNPKINDQIVLVSNICGKPIKVQVCYIKSSDCIIVALQAYQKLERVLGISYSSSEFRFEYRELF
jgi:hypothetical protein